MTQDETYETVFIYAGATVETNDNTLTVTNSGGLTCAGTLLIESAGAVVLNGGGSHCVTGLIQLEGGQSSSTLRASGSTQATLADIEPLHPGRIEGMASNAIVDVTSGSTLISELDIIGSMTITGSGHLKNEDSVMAEGIIVLDSNLHLCDSSGALWEADGGTLQFKHGQTGNSKLNGSIRVQRCGILRIDASVRTGGAFVHELGSLIVSPNQTFVYAAFSSSHGCDNPATSGSPVYTVPPDCYVCGCDPPCS